MQVSLIPYCFVCVQFAHLFEGAKRQNVRGSNQSALSVNVYGKDARTLKNDAGRRRVLLWENQFMGRLPQRFEYLRP
ncbi:hypothetical protein AWENTII_004473 [Aspergillus wentii]